MKKMAKFSDLVSLALFISTLLFSFHDSSIMVNGLFQDTMYIYWGYQHSTMQGDDLQLVLDQTSGSGVQSKGTFLFGSIEMQIKLVPGNSAGTVTTYYLSSTGEASTGDKHDEIDFEFLGNVTGQPYIIHTNIFTQGVGGREQQFYLWFDPTADYHNYTIHWNPNTVVWYVDSVPIRVFRNYESQGVLFPNKQGMGVYSSLWNADEWATRGGRDKIDWTNSPFIARYKNFNPQGCFWNGQGSIYQCAAPSPQNWWTNSEHYQLSYAKKGQMDWVRSNFMIYDYCNDTKRFNGNFPSECYMPQY